MRERRLLMKLYTIPFLLSEGPIYSAAFPFLERQHPKILTTPPILQSHQAYGLNWKKPQVTLLSCILEEHNKDCQLFCPWGWVFFPFSLHRLTQILIVESVSSNGLFLALILVFFVFLVVKNRKPTQTILRKTKETYWIIWLEIPKVKLQKQLHERSQAIHLDPLSL